MADQPAVATFLSQPPQELPPVAPFTPNEAHEAFLASIPSEVIEEVNKRLRRDAYNPDARIVIGCDEVREEIIRRGLTPTEISQNSWMHIEALYRRYGWSVEYLLDGAHRWVFTRSPDTPPMLSVPAQINLSWDVTVHLTSLGEAELARFKPESSGHKAMTKALQPDGSYKLPLYQLIALFGHLMLYQAGTDTTPFETMFVITPTP